MPVFSPDQIGSSPVRFSSKGVFETHKDRMVNPYAETLIPKEAQVEGIQFWPQAKGKYPCLVLLHDQWGLTFHINELARRFACEGYVVLAPNLYGRQGGMITANAEVAQALMERMNEELVLQDIHASCEFLNANLPEDPNLEFTKRNIHGIVGWGMGGTLAIRFALKRKRLRAVVSFYGRLPEPLESIQQLSCPLLYHAAEKNEAADDQALEQLCRYANEAGKSVEIRRYPGTCSGFSDPMRSDVYDESQTHLAWEETLAFLRKQLV
ncbi:MAG: dienelactone hydrolase family protein [Nitrospirae bacterium]|nr:MAG: dienelactone hydrolase family protein [Nitrospirota bacterium]